MFSSMHWLHDYNCCAVVSTVCTLRLVKVKGTPHEHWVTPLSGVQGRFISGACSSRSFIGTGCRRRSRFIRWVLDFNDDEAVEVSFSFEATVLVTPGGDGVSEVPFSSKVMSLVASGGGGVPESLTTAAMWSEHEVESISLLVGLGATVDELEELVSAEELLHSNVSGLPSTALLSTSVGREVTGNCWEESFGLVAHWGTWFAMPCVVLFLSATPTLLASLWTACSLSASSLLRCYITRERTSTLHLFLKPVRKFLLP